MHRGETSGEKPIARSIELPGDLVQCAGRVLLLQTLRPGSPTISNPAIGADSKQRIVPCDLGTLAQGHCSAQPIRASLLNRLFSHVFSLRRAEHNPRQAKPSASSVLPIDRWPARPPVGNNGDRDQETRTAEAEGAGCLGTWQDDGTTASPRLAQKGRCTAHGPPGTRDTLGIHSYIRTHRSVRRQRALIPGSRRAWPRPRPCLRPPRNVKMRNKYAHTSRRASRAKSDATRRDANRREWTADRTAVHWGTHDGTRANSSGTVDPRTAHRSPQHASHRDSNVKYMHVYGTLLYATFRISAFSNG